MSQLSIHDAAPCVLAGALAVLVAVDARARDEREAADPPRARNGSARPAESGTCPSHEKSGSDGSRDLREWSARELRALPGIGETRANAIVRARHSGEISGSAESLERVHGIGPETVRAIVAELKERGPANDVARPP